MQRAQYTRGLLFFCENYGHRSVCVCVCVFADISQSPGFPSAGVRQDASYYTHCGSEPQRDFVFLYRGDTQVGMFFERKTE